MRTRLILAMRFPFCLSLVRRSPGTSYWRVNEAASGSSGDVSPGNQPKEPALHRTWDVEVVDECVSISALVGVPRNGSGIRTAYA